MSTPPNPYNLNLDCCRHFQAGGDVSSGGWGVGGEGGRAARGSAGLRNGDGYGCSKGSAALSNRDVYWCGRYVYLCGKGSRGYTADVV